MKGDSMRFTEPAMHLLELYNDAELNNYTGEILEIPEFTHDYCNVVVTFKPSDYESVVGVMAVKIRTSENVTFSPFYLKLQIDELGNDVVEFIPFFDKLEYKALKDEIIAVDGYSTNPLFQDIENHILDCTTNDVIHGDAHTWIRHKSERTVQPSPANDDVSPMTIKSVRIGQSSKDRLYRMFPYEEARQIVNALWNNNKTIVFTSNPKSARNIYALFADYHITIE